MRDSPAGGGIDPPPEHSKTSREFFPRADALRRHACSDALRPLINKLKLRTQSILALRATAEQWHEDSILRGGMLWVR